MRFAGQIGTLVRTANVQQLPPGAKFQVVQNKGAGGQIVTLVKTSQGMAVQTVRHFIYLCFAYAIFIFIYIYHMNKF